MHRWASLRGSYSSYLIKSWNHWTMFQTGWGWSESSEIRICMQKNVKVVEIVAFNKTQDCNLLVILYIQVCCSALWVAHSEVETEPAAECDATLTFSSEITSLTEGNGDIHSRSLSPWNWTWVNSWMNLWIDEWLSKNRSNSDKCQIPIVAVFVTQAKHGQKPNPQDALGGRVQHQLLFQSHPGTEGPTQPELSPRLPGHSGPDLTQWPALLQSIVPLCGGRLHLCSSRDQSEVKPRKQKCFKIKGAKKIS